MINLSLKTFINLVTVSIFFSIETIAQNLVVNPSFENFTNCPLGPGNFNNYVQTWVNPYSTNSCSSPDYYNGCNTNTFAGVPVNFLGNQAAATGVAYAGIMLFDSNSNVNSPCLPPKGNDYREYILGILSSPLIAGKVYNVSFSISLPDNIMYACADLGVYLSAVNPSLTCPPPLTSTVLPYTPQLNYTGAPVTNTTGWTLLQWTYTATGGEQYIVIGNFKNDANTIGLCHNQTVTNYFSYYYIDDVNVDTVVTSTTLNVTTSATNILCNNLCTGAATANPTGTSPYTYSWNTTPVQTTQTATALCAGSYTVTVTDANNNTATSVVTISQPTALTASTNTTASVCTNNNGTATVTANGGSPGYTYLWSPSGGTNTTATNLAPGIYTVTVTDTNGCTQTASAIITQSSGTLVTNTNSTSSSCIGNTGSATVNASGGTPTYSYLWNPGGNTSSSINNLSPGTYTVTVIDINGCTSTAIANIGITGVPTAIVSPDVSITIGTSTQLNASGGINYNWFPATNLSCTNCANPFASPTETTTYCVEVTDSNGCKDTACVTISIDLKCPDVIDFKVPNAFSPNDDNVNDEFCLQGWNLCIEDFMIVIFNRWGEKVYESKDPNFCWDGKYNSSINDAHVFTYYIKATHKVSGEKFTKNGNITLIR